MMLSWKLSSVLSALVLREDLELDFLVALLHTLVRVEDLVVDGSFKLRILGGLTVAGAVKNLRDELKIALGFDKFRDGPINFVLRQRLPMLKTEFAKSLLLQLGALSHDRR